MLIPSVFKKNDFPERLSWPLRSELNIKLLARKHTKGRITYVAAGSQSSLSDSLSLFLQTRWPQMFCTAWTTAAAGGIPCKNSQLLVQTKQTKVYGANTQRSWSLWFDCTLARKHDSNHPVLQIRCIVRNTKRRGSLKILKCWFDLYIIMVTWAEIANMSATLHTIK